MLLFYGPLCMYVCMCACVRVCVRACVCVRVYVLTCVSTYVRTYVRYYVRTFLRTHACMYVSLSFETPVCFNGPSGPCSCIAVPLEVNKTARLLIQAQQRFLSLFQYITVKIKQISTTSCIVQTAGLWEKIWMVFPSLINCNISNQRGTRW